MRGWQEGCVPPTTQVRLCVSDGGGVRARVRQVKRVRREGGRGDGISSISDQAAPTIGPNPKVIRSWSSSPTSSRARWVRVTMDSFISNPPWCRWGLPPSASFKWSGFISQGCFLFCPLHLPPPASLPRMQRVEIKNKRADDWRMLLDRDGGTLVASCPSCCPSLRPRACVCGGGNPHTPHPSALLHVEQARACVGGSPFLDRPVWYGGSSDRGLARLRPHTLLARPRPSSSVLSRFPDLAPSPPRQALEDGLVHPSAYPPLGHGDVCDPASCLRLLHGVRRQVLALVGELS